LWSTSRLNLCITVILPALEAQEKGCLASPYIPTFEQCAAKHLLEAQDWADHGVVDSALEFQTKARLAQERASAGISVRNTPTTKNRTPNRDEVVNAGQPCGYSRNSTTSVGVVP
jgi:hypothetical protein